MKQQHRLTVANWPQHQSLLQDLRNKINVLELRIPQSIEFDEKDIDSQHVLVCDNDEPIACGRITRTGVISRICVLSSYRSKGVGALVFKGLVDLAKQSDMSIVNVSARLDTLDFYTQYGFMPQGNVFMQGGIPRRHASCQLSDISFT